MHQFGKYYLLCRMFFKLEDLKKGKGRYCSLNSTVRLSLQTNRILEWLLQKK